MKPRSISAVFLLLTLFFIIQKTEAQEKRIALVIGNSAYTQGSALANPVNDANLMAATLQQFGFEVKKLNNATLKQMQSAAIEFTDKISNYDVALFYYAGHGVSVDGINYLIPVDAQLVSKLSAKYEAFSINDINDAFAQNSGKMNIMILDACRDNPFRSWMRGGERGFKAVGNQATGTIISFATREGETADDGSGSNGLFTEKLVGQMKVHQNINDVFKNTRVQVLKASGNKQCPQEWDMSVGSFYFAENTSPAEIVREPAAAGSIQLITELSGKFYIDGVFYKDVSAGGTYTFNNIQSGVRVLSLSGTVNWTEKVAVISGQTTTVTAKKEAGSIELYSEIAGTFYIDNVQKKSITANSTNTFSDISAGVHQLKIEGSQPWAENVFVSAGQTVKVTVNKVVKTGSVNIASQIDGKLYIDDVYRQTISAGSSPAIGELNEGTHTAKIKDASTGKELWSDSFEINKGQTTYLTAKAVVTVQASGNYTETAGGVNIEMVFVKGGTFTMGCTSEQGGDCGDDEKPSHSVTLSDFYIGKYEVTIGQYMKFVNETGSHYPEWLETGSSYNINGSGSKKDYYSSRGMSLTNTSNPITGVSWNDAKAYCDWLSSKTGKKYSLPTEAQWEYSARGGASTGSATATKYSGSNDIGEVAWYSDSSGSKTHPVGQKQPNELGIFDMSGNVWEWCSDWYGSYSSGSQTNPTGSSSGSYRVLRGGSWSYGAGHCRSAYRRRSIPDNRNNVSGFRLVLLP